MACFKIVEETNVAKNLACLSFESNQYPMENIYLKPNGLCTGAHN